MVSMIRLTNYDRSYKEKLKLLLKERCQEEPPTKGLLFPRI